MQKIVPHLWFDKEAVEAAKFYTTLFDNSSIETITQLKDTPGGDSDSVTLKLDGQDFMFISAGPIFQLNPSISLMVHCSTIEEINQLWDTLSDEGTVLMELKEYQYSQRFGWLNDRYGVSWQLIYANEPFEQKIVPCIMYTGQQAGNAKEAIELYTSLFDHSKIELLLQYDAQRDPNHEGMLQYASFTIEGYQLVAMDSTQQHEFDFNEAFSILVSCDTQEEIDFLWDEMSAIPEAEQCGWLKDRYGVSWQLSPTILSEMLTNGDEAQRGRVTQAFLKMKKMDIAKLQQAYEGE